METQTNTPLPPRFHPDEVVLPQHNYQPPISCSHGHFKKAEVRVRKVRLIECKDCGFTVGMVGQRLPEAMMYPPEPKGPVTVFLKPPPSRFTLWVADQLDGLERACMPPESWIRWWHETF